MEPLAYKYPEHITVPLSWRVCRGETVFSFPRTGRIRGIMKNRCKSDWKRILGPANWASQSSGFCGAKRCFLHWNLESTRGSLENIRCCALQRYVDPSGNHGLQVVALYESTPHPIFQSDTSTSSNYILSISGPIHNLFQ